MPIASTRRCIRSLTPPPENATGTKSSSTMPTRMSAGPSSLFMYFWSQCDTPGAESRLATSSAAITRYASARPSV
jgi:hypothetical protein